MEEFMNLRSIDNIYLQPLSFKKFVLFRSRFDEKFLVNRNPLLFSEQEVFINESQVLHPEDLLETSDNELYVHFLYEDHGHLLNIYQLIAICKSAEVLNEAKTEFYRQGLDRSAFILKNIPELVVPGQSVTVSQRRAF